MQETVTAARRLYDALGARDPAAILGALHEDFVGDVSAGMPLGVGGRHKGPEAMLRDVWGRVFAAYDLEVLAEELLPSGDRVTALGRYRGIERATGRSVEAVFAHILAVRDDRVCGLVQVTDTARW